MSEIAFTVERAEFRGWKFWISANVQGEYDSRVRNPKVTVIFDSGTQKRRVPLLIRSYTTRNGKFLLYAEYGYDVRDIFYNEPLGRKITVSFDLMYGEDYFEHIPFRTGESAAGQVMMDDSEGEEEESEETETREFYDIEFSLEKGEICLLAKFKEKKVSLSHKMKEEIQAFIGGIWRLLLLFLGIGLLPFFLADAVLAVLGCIPKKDEIASSRTIIYLIKHARWRLTVFCNLKIGVLPIKLSCMSVVNWLMSKGPIKQNRVVFFSNRRNDLSGNFEFVYDLLRTDPNLDIRFVLDDRPVRKMSFHNMLRLARYFANARVILVDDYMELLFKMPRREGTTLIQLWHACGAFKTFGCSRMGKSGGQTLKSMNHRTYDFATVSSQEIAKFYAEGFGLSPEKVVATGIPRTDIFFDEEYREKVTEEFYRSHPKLKGKKILLFAPTFRGNGKNSGYYPVDLFDVNKLYEQLGEEYAIIIKHHPFVKNRNTIRKEYKDYIVDLSMNSELNDLLFVTDILITDYSSVVFEASLLRIPMLFYVFDLEQYIATRGFYYEFETFVPGKIASSFSEAVQAIATGDLEQEKIEAFRDRFFDDKDGRSTQRTVDLIYKSMK